MPEITKTKVLIAATEFEPLTNVGHLGRAVMNLSVALNRYSGAAHKAPANGERSVLANNEKSVQANGEKSVLADNEKSVQANGEKSVQANGDPLCETDVRVVIPRYSSIPKKFLSAARRVCDFTASLGRRTYACTVHITDYRGVWVYLLSCADYFKGEHVYSSVGDDVERYSCFCNAVLKMLPKIEFEPDVIQCHDWQMSFIPTLLKTGGSRRAHDEALKTLFVIHSMQYQGVCSRYEMLDMLDLSSDFFTPSTLEFYGEANSLKGGLLFSDKLATVSRNYASEIQHAYYGENLEGIIRVRSADLRGILCGIDPEIYNPATDERVYVNYDASTLPENKPANKRRLQELLGFEGGADTPLIIIIADELDFDKGMDLIKFVFDDIAALGVQLVIASRGETGYHDFFMQKAGEYKGKVAYVRFNGGLYWDGEKWAGWDELYGGGAEAHKPLSETMLISGSDMLLRPSRVEPCGEKHLIALKYGTLPIVRETGGLKDAVEPYNAETGAGNGFTFFNYNAHDMLYTLKNAVSVYNDDKPAWNRMTLAAMSVNVTWDAAAAEYMEIYETLREA